MKRFKYLIMSLIGLAVIGTSISYAFFNFGEETQNKDAIQDLRVDNIFENYKTIQADLGATRLSDKQFTVYIFPSAEYFQIYKSYLEGSSNVKPEDLAGYLQPVLNDDGTCKKDANGNTIYDIHRDLPGQEIQNTTLNFAGGNTSSSTFPTDAYVRHVQSYMTLHDQTLDNKSFIPDYTLINDSQNWSTGLSESSYDHKSRIYEIYKYYINTTSNKRTYGAPTDAPFDWDASPNGYVGNYKLYIDGKGQDGYKTLFPTDRFGYWKNLTMEEGRFLPIKIDVVNSLSPTAFTNSIGPLDTSMNDGNSVPWFDMSISGFTYVDHNKPSVDNQGVQRSYTLPYANLPKGHLPGYSQPLGTQTSGEYLDILPRDFFGTYDLNNIFDFTKVLSNYADEKGIVRLFPTFSNGKGYWASKTNNNVFGGRDGVKFETVQYDPNDQEFLNKFAFPMNPASALNKDWTSIATTQTPVFSSRYANYNASDPTNPNPSNPMKVYMASLTNVPINMNNKRTRIRVRIAPAFGTSTWNSGWLYTYDLDFGKVFNQLTPGNYNFYLFQGNSGEPNNSYYSESDSINGIFEHQFKGGNVYQFFPELSGKKLINIPYKRPGVGDNQPYFNFVDHTKDGGARNTDNKTIGYENNRPIYMLMQKATEPKIYTDLNPDFKTTEEIQQIVDDTYDTAYCGYTLERPVYKLNNTGKKLKRIFTKPAPNDNKTLDNCYLFNGVDFTDVNFDYFQFRFGNLYDPIINLASDNSNINWPIYMNINNQPLEYSGATTEFPTLKDYLAVKAVAFYPISHLFGDEGVQNPFMIPSIQGQVDLSNFLKIFEENARGIYDMLFVPTGNPSSTNVTFNVYLHRHTNIFIKLFEHKVTSKYVPQDEENITHSEFIDHDTVDASNDLLWRKSFYIGDSVKPTSKSITNDRSSLEDAFKNYIDTVLEPGASGQEKYTKYVIKDQTTDAPICYFKLVDGSAKLFIASEFKVIKNYIWYITIWDK